MLLCKRKKYSNVPMLSLTQYTDTHLMLDDITLQIKMIKSMVSYGKYRVLLEKCNSNFYNYQCYGCSMLIHVFIAIVKNSRTRP